MTVLECECDVAGDVTARLSQPPQLAAGPVNTTVIAGHHVQLRCLSFSSEPSLTRWLKHHQVNGSFLDENNRLSYFSLITVRHSFQPAVATHRYDNSPLK